MAVVNPQHIDTYYQIDAEVGVGGMAVVYRVTDTRDGKVVALKRMRHEADQSKQASRVDLFQREFHTLAQQRHPCIVRVYDYGLEGEDPYYTMELLDGGDLKDLAPVPWREACSLARDVCSALSLLHSRRFVYRDLSARNVRRTGDHRAKLIDFGAVAPMGPCRQIIGTPAFTAPEVVDFELLDARTDLFALGATLYYCLTGRAPYPARTFHDLRAAWRVSPTAVSHYVPEVPPALDGLLIDLLQLDPDSRPASATEVMERLTGIAELPVDEELLVAQAYLTTPTLVGRAAQLDDVRARVLGAQQGRGAALLLSGTQGLGRSRFLDAAVLQAKLQGMLVVRADADDAHGDYGVAHAICVRLLAMLPDIARVLLKPFLPVLGTVMPDLLEQSQDVTLIEFEDPAHSRRRVQQALRDWFEAVIREHPCLLAIDDLHHIDGPSAAFVALLGCESVQSPLVLIATINPDVRGNETPVELLAGVAVTRQLDRLTAHETRELLESLLGDVPNLDRLATRLHELSGGNPGDAMHLAQHLVDTRVLSFRSGAWTVPSVIDMGDLPETLADSFQQVIVGLRSETRQLALAFALAHAQTFTLRECSRLCGETDLVRLLRLLDELLTAGVIRQAADRYSLRHSGWITALRAGTKQEEPSLHARLGDLFEARGMEIAAVGHFFDAGQELRAVDLLVEHAEASQKLSDASSAAYIQLVESLPADWLSYYDRALAICEEQGRPARESFQLLSRLAGLMSVTGAGQTRLLERLLAHLYVASGLDIHATLDPSLPPGDRLRTTFELSQARFDETRPSARTVDPFAAIRQLGRALIQSSAVIVTTRNLAFARSLPSVRPYADLSPAVNIVQQIVDGIVLRYSGRTDQATAIYHNCLERLGQPDRAGLDESHHRQATFGIRLGLGLLHSSVGARRAMAIADELETNPLYEVSAWHVRMAYHLLHAETHKAEQCRSRAELVSVQNHTPQFLDGGHVPVELCAHVLAGSVLDVRRSVHTMESWARRFAGWQPLLDYAQGEYNRLRGDYTRALIDLRRSAGPDEHQLWADAAGAEITTLCDMHEWDRAVDVGRARLETAGSRALGSNLYLIEVPLAWAEFRRGSLEHARQFAHSALARLEALGSTGLRMAGVHAICARVATSLHQPDEASYHTSQMAAQFEPSADRRILVRYEALLHDDFSDRNPTGSGNPRVRADLIGTQTEAPTLDARGDNTSTFTGDDAV